MWYLRCTVGPAAVKGPEAFAGTAASCGVPVQHAPPTTEENLCTGLTPRRRDVPVLHYVMPLELTEGLIPQFSFLIKTQLHFNSHFFESFRQHKNSRV